MVDTLSREKRSWNMSRIKGKDTKPELMLRSMLHRAGFRFRIHDSRLPGKPDVVLPRYDTVIFVNGCFWHRHEGCKFSYTPKSRQDFWQKKFIDTVLRDQEKEKQLIQQGWSVITIWECELKKGPVSILNKLIEELKGI
jgi:DNA mismatch endonuclease (patch repair protein)